MSQEQLNNENTDSKTSTNSRRKFLVKASAGAIVATIPAQSVWATGTANAGSVMASNVASTFGTGTAVVVKKPHEWSHLFGHHELAKKYHDICGTSPKLHWTISNHLGNKVSDIRMCHILGATDSIKNFLKYDCGSEVDRYSRLIIRYSNGAVRYRAHMSTVHTWLKDSEEVNALIASAYLNAKFSGQQGIFYPIVRSAANPHAPFTSAEDFLLHLHNSRLSSVSRTAEILRQLHNNPNQV